MGREFELKYQASPHILAQIQKDLGEFSSIAMETTYLDTPKGELRKRRWMLRRRLENSQAVYCLKTPLPDGSRGEWECRAADLPQALAQLSAQNVPQAFIDLCREDFRPVCGAKFTRLAKTLTPAHCTLELALDQGAFVSGDRCQPFAEIEVEFKAGDEQAAVAFAQGLAAQYHLVPETKSKAQRARELGDAL